jgi:hypothetical protein
MLTTNYFRRCATALVGIAACTAVVADSTPDHGKLRKLMERHKQHATRAAQQIDVGDFLCQTFVQDESDEICSCSSSGADYVVSCTSPQLCLSGQVLFHLYSCPGEICFATTTDLTFFDYLTLFDGDTDTRVDLLTELSGDTAYEAFRYGTTTNNAPAGNAFQGELYFTLKNGFEYQCNEIKDCVGEDERIQYYCSNIQAGATSNGCIANSNWVFENFSLCPVGGAMTPTTPAVGGGPSGVVCFPGDAKALVKDKGEVPMKALRLGDKVRVANNKYEPIYSFGHKNEDTVAEFLQIFTDEDSSRAGRGDQPPLELSKDHMVFISSNQQGRGRAVPASMIRNGDHVVAATGELVVVKEIRTVVRKGVYAPFTKSGSIVVDGILASTYVAIQGTPDCLLLTINIGISYQWLAHTFESVRRLVMRVVKGGEETYTHDGLSRWVDGPHKFMSWVLEQNRVVAIGIALPLLSCLLAISLIEKALLFDSASVFATLLVGCATTTFLVLLIMGKAAGGTWKAKFKCGLAK